LVNIIVDIYDVLILLSLMTSSWHTLLQERRQYKTQCVIEAEDRGREMYVQVDLLLKLDSQCSEAKPLNLW